MVLPRHERAVEDVERKDQREGKEVPLVFAYERGEGGDGAAGAAVEGGEFLREVEGGGGHFFGGWEDVGGLFWEGRGG